MPAARARELAEIYKLSGIVEGALGNDGRRDRGVREVAGDRSEGHAAAWHVAEDHAAVRCGGEVEATTLKVKVETAGGTAVGDARDRRTIRSTS